MHLHRSFLLVLALRCITFFRDFAYVVEEEDGNIVLAETIDHPHDQLVQLRPKPLSTALQADNQEEEETATKRGVRGRNQEQQQQPKGNKAKRKQKKNRVSKKQQQQQRNLQGDDSSLQSALSNSQAVLPMAVKREHLFAPRTSLTDDGEPGFDFIIAGFPKCGTTTLLKAFGAHDETDMAASEQCAIASPLQADAKVHRLLDATLQDLSTDPSTKRSFKCPTAMYSYKSITRMEKHSPNTKFVIGMRHPVKMLQSFYNYRITELKEKGLESEPIPTLHEIIDSGVPWKGVSLQSTRFELFLLQLGKTTVTDVQMSELVTQHQYDLAIKPTQFQVFLYTVDQLEDTDPVRSKTLRTTLQRFLGLQKPIQPFGHENKNHAVGKAAHNESISICDPQWAAIRAKLVQQGAATAHWIRSEFIHSEDVLVANQKHFLATLESWGTDPCLEAAAEA